MMIKRLVTIFITFIFFFNCNFQLHSSLIFQFKPVYANSNEQFQQDMENHATVERGVQDNRIDQEHQEDVVLEEDEMATTQVEDDGGLQTEGDMIYNMILAVIFILAGVQFGIVCSEAWDPWVAVSISSIFLIWEIANFSEFEETLYKQEREMTAKTSVSQRAVDAQKESIDQAISSTTAAIAFADRRLDSLYFGSWSYGLLAIGVLFAGLATCWADGGTCGACLGKCAWTKNNKKKMKKNKLSNEEFFYVYRKKEVRPTPFLQQLNKLFIQLHSQNGHKKSNTENIFIKEVASNSCSDQLNNSSDRNNFGSFKQAFQSVYKLFDYVIPETIAGETAGMVDQIGFSAGLGLIAMMLYKTISFEQCTLSTNYLTRAGYYAGAALLVISATAEAEVELGALEERKKAYEALKNKIEKSTKELSKLEANDLEEGLELDQLGNLDLQANGNQEAGPEGLRGKCAAGSIKDINSFSMNEENCTNGKSRPKFKKIDFSQVGIDPNSAVANDLNSIMDGANQLMNGEGISKELQANMNKAAATKRLNQFRKLLKKLKNSDLGKKYPDIDKMEEFARAQNLKLKNKIKAQVAALPADQLASINDALSGGIIGKKIDDGGIYEKMLAAKKGIGGADSDFSEIEPSSLFGDLMEEDSSPLVKDEKNEGVNYDKLSKFKLKENDIVKDPGVPIWKLLSRRYERSAFPRLFVELDVFKKKKPKKNKNLKGKKK